jgi:hypothetical protein
LVVVLAVIGTACTSTTPHTGPGPTIPATTALIAPTGSASPPRRLWLSFSDPGLGKIQYPPNWNLETQSPFCEPGQLVALVSNWPDTVPFQPGGCTNGLDYSSVPGNFVGVSLYSNNGRGTSPRPTTSTVSKASLPLTLDNPADIERLPGGLTQEIAVWDHEGEYFLAATFGPGASTEDKIVAGIVVSSFTPPSS